MATIKIDRGFTQKIQHKAVAAPPTQGPHSGKGAPKKKGLPLGLILGLCGAAVVVVVIAAAALGGKKEKRAAAPAAAPAAPDQAAAAAQPAAQPAAPEPVAPDPEAELYAKHSGQPAPQAAPAQPANKPGGGPTVQKPVWRESPLGGAQGLRCDYYERISGKQISAIRAAAAFPDRPDRTVQVSNFELSEDIAENYGARVRGFLVPSASGAYRFSVVADDGAELWLSSDDSPAHVRRLVGYEACTQKGQWTSRGDQQSPECELVAGQRYYVEAFLKENTGHDYLAVAWKGPVSGQYAVIDGRFLQPWTEGAPAAAAAPGAPGAARAAVAEQFSKHAPAHRYAEAADALKAGKASWQDPDALALVETAILRLELLGRLRAFVQAELAKAPVRGVWTAFGGQADVTTATDEGVTVAPGRIVEWPKVPAEQLLKLVNAVVPKAAADPATKGVTLLAAAVYCKDVTGGLELALKYRERALAMQASLSALADRVLGGTPEGLQAELRMKGQREELGRAVASAAGLADALAKQQADLAAVTGLVPGVLAEYWLKNPHGHLSEARKKGFLQNRPDDTQVLKQLETPRDYAEKFIGRLRAYLTPPASGEYYFYLAADDQGELWLSPDETPEKLALLVKTDNYNNYRAWDRDKRRSPPITLEKGRHYLVEAFLREGEKNDHLSVAWSPVADDAPAVITADSLLYAATAGFTPQAQEVRQRLEADLQKVAGALAEVSAIRAADQGRQSGDEAPSPAAADALQQQVDRAKAALREAEAQMKQNEATHLQLKKLSAPDAARP